MTRTLPTLALACLFLLPACSTSTPEDSKPAKQDAKQDAPKADPAPEDATPEPTEGYTAYLVSALGDLAAGGPPKLTETKPYGCSVKYAGDGGEASAKVGEAAPTFTLPDLDGNSISLADYAGKTVVLEWFNPDCPFVVYAHGDDGPLANLAREQSEAGIVWLAINSGAEGKQGHGAERNRKAREDWKLDHPILLDENGAVGQTYGAKTTPQMFVIDPDGKIAYAGAVDNAPLGQVEG